MHKVIIRNISNAIKGGNLAVIVGDGFSEPKVYLESLINGMVTEAVIINRTDTHTITFRVPDGRFQAYSVTVESDGVTSEPYIMNVPEIKWIQGEFISCNEEFRVFGHAFVDIDRYEERNGIETSSYGGFFDNSGVTVSICDANGKISHAKVLSASCYEVKAIAPDNLETGECTVTIGNNCGGISKSVKTVVSSYTTYPIEIFNVCDYGAKAIDLTDVFYKGFQDSSEGFQKALDAAKSNGGGTVFIPNGRYCFKSGIRIPRFTKLIGESPKRVWLELPKGMDGEDGWGTWEEGEKIQVFIGGDGDFTIENVNILAVYSPVIIGAPAIHGEPKLGDDKFNRIPCYCNLIDQTKDADNIVIKNCNIVHEPTFLVQRKRDKKELFFVDEYDNRNKKDTALNGNMHAVLNIWAAIAIKGKNIKIIDNQIQGAGSAVNLMGSQNSVISGNILYAGDMGNCLGLFSTSYNPDDNWSRAAKNIIIEDNVFDVATNLTRGVMWIMQEHVNYSMARNVIKPFYWTCDTEGFCFHTWGDHWSIRIHGGNRTLLIDKNSFSSSYDYVNCKKFIEADGSMKKSIFKDWYCTVVGGTGIGQTRMITDNTDGEIMLDSEWDCDLDESSVINISTFDKFRNTLIIDNEVNELGRGIYHWGSAFNSIVDGNTLCKNSGVLMEDLSMHYIPLKNNWQFAGHFFNQIINNKLTMPRGFCSNYGVIGVSGGTVAGSTVSMIIRGNVAEDDSVIVACPLNKAEDDLNYKGIVIEDNMSKNCIIGIKLDENISASLKGNEFENVTTKVTGMGSHTVSV